MSRYQQSDKMKKSILTIVFCAGIGLLSIKAETRVVSHRGYHTKPGSAENTISSLQNAQVLGVYGMEFDVNMTSDDSLIVYHGPWIGEQNVPGSIHIQKSTFADVRARKINGVHLIPSLQEFFAQAAKDKSMRLVLEVKKHANTKRETQVVEAVVSLIRKMKMENQIEFLSFSQHICKELMRVLPGSKVIYVNGDLSPKQLKEQGYAGLSYNLNVLMNAPEWIDEARALGLETTLWMVEQPDIAEWGIRHKVDFLSTNNPVMVKEVIKKAAKK